MENLKIDVLSLFCQPVHRRGWETHFQTKKISGLFDYLFTKEKEIPTIWCILEISLTRGIF